MAMWDGFVDGPGRTTALRAVIECLGESETCERLIARLASASRKASLDDQKLVIDYANPEDETDLWTLTLLPPHLGAIGPQVPASFARLAQQINGIVFENNDAAWVWNGLTPEGEIDDAGAFAPNQLEDGGNAELLTALAAHGLDASAIIAPIQHHQDWIIYHPFTKTAHGEPALCRFSHDSCKVDDPLTLELGLPATILRLLVAGILHADDVPWTR